MATKRVLLLLAPGFEEIETITPIDLLRRAGAEVVVAAVNGENFVTGRCNVTIHTDAALDDIENQHFDLLVIPGGPGVAGLRKDGRPAALAKAFFGAGKPIGAICAGPTVLADAGLLEGKKFTAHFSVYGELTGALAEERVVESGQIITSRGAGTAVDFGLALVKLLFGPAAAKEVSDAIMA
ncbi:MAG TPA: DJ-1 family glyoxalase III [Chthoniobacterales bacterium]